MNPKVPKKGEGKKTDPSKGVPENAVPSKLDGPSDAVAFRPRLDILPPSQRALWPALRPLAGMGFVLYGGTAIALRLGHRESVDFDFFTDRPFDHQALIAALPFAKEAQLLQEDRNTLTLLAAHPDHPNGPVKVSFFGGMTMGRVGMPEVTEDGVLLAASMRDLLANKLKVIHERAEKKDYLDIHALISAGFPLADGLACASALFSKAFQPRVALQAMTYFKDGNLRDIPPNVQKALAKAATSVETIPPAPEKSPILGVVP